MRPFTVLIGIVLGSAASITFGLGAVLIVFCVLAGEHPDLSRELPQLAGKLGCLRRFDRRQRREFRRTGTSAFVARLGAPGDRGVPGRGNFAVLAAPKLSPECAISCELDPFGAFWPPPGCCCAPVRCAPRCRRLPPTSMKRCSGEHLRMLASDEFEGRKPGTPGEEKTVAYLVEQFRKLGLKPGNGESFLQQVPMTEIVAGADASLSIERPQHARSRSATARTW